MHHSLVVATYGNLETKFFSFFVVVVVWCGDAVYCPRCLPCRLPCRAFSFVVCTFFDPLHTSSLGLQPDGTTKLPPVDPGSDSGSDMDEETYRRMIASAVAAEAADGA